MHDAHDLQRFVAAQDADDTYARALAELRAGRKRTHWMWFVLPQLAGLGRSDMARRYGISGLAEACAYLEHPVLGPRLVECAQALLESGEDDPILVMGSIDAAKLRSSMTLFAAAAPDERAFVDVLVRYFPGGRDPATIARLESER
ncbi:MAG: hypothetical protein JWL76_474 [Thermoleophilia bacterium]|nr:hypothetical protein [Thermoleophilia bacterium]